MINLKELINLIKKHSLGEYKENVSFKTLTTYKTGGTAKIVIYPNNIDSLKEVLIYLKNNNIKHKVFGNGSNILASDKIYEGAIIKLNNLNDLKVNNNQVEVEAGFNFSLLCNKMTKEGYQGLEFGGGIPATVGGAIYMNAGAYLEDTSTSLEKVTFLDENYNLVTKTKKDLDFSYRHSIFMEKDWIILKAYFILTKGNTKELADLIKDRKERRISSQPLEYSSAGSVFRNPEGMYAGKLIEECGLKGLNHNGAEISTKHANFIINKENATSSDIAYLMELCQKEVNKKYNIKLHREQELFNWEK